MKIKKIATLAAFTALYVALSAALRVPVIGNISLDLGYIALAAAILLFGYTGTIVGVLGCALESILFSPYGFSLSWAAGNLFVGLIFACAVRKIKHNSFIYMAFALIGCLVGIGIVKTAIEVPMFSIPLAIKLPKNLIAAAVDAFTMWIGIWIFNEKLCARLREIN